MRPERGDQRAGAAALTQRQRLYLVDREIRAARGSLVQLPRTQRNLRQAPSIAWKLCS